MYNKLIPIVLLFSHFLIAQNFPGARQNGFSNAFTAISDDHWSIFYNPSGLVNVKNFSAGVYYSPAPFGLKELATANATASKKFSFGNIAIGFQTFGFELFRENKLYLSYGYSPFENFSSGISLKFYSYSIQNYGNDFAVGLDLGILANITENILMGFSFHNLNRPTVGLGNERLPQIFIAGFAFKAHKSTLFSIETEKDIKYPFNIKFGLEYELIKYVQLRFGYNTEPAKFATGIGIIYDNFTFDYAFNYHTILGITHSFGINFTMN